MWKPITALSTGRSSLVVNNVMVPRVPLFKQGEVPPTLIERPSGVDRFFGIGIQLRLITKTSLTR